MTDPDRWRRLVDEALAAFGADERYAVRMARRARWLIRQRERLATLRAEGRLNGHRAHP